MIIKISLEIRLNRYVVGFLLIAGKIIVSFS